jgi:hypothetical protein
MSSKQEQILSSSIETEKLDLGFFSKLLYELRDNVGINLDGINRFVHDETPKVIEATGKMNNMYPDMYNVLSKYTNENETTIIMADMLKNQHAVQLLVVGKLDDLANLKQLFDNLFSIILSEEYRKEFIQDIQKYKENPKELTGGGGLSTSLLSSNKFTQTVILLFLCMCVNGFITQDQNPFAHNITPTPLGNIASSSSLSASGNMPIVTIGESKLSNELIISGEGGIEVKNKLQDSINFTFPIPDFDNGAFLELINKKNNLEEIVTDAQNQLKELRAKYMTKNKEIEQLNTELLIAEGFIEKLGSDLSTSEKKNQVSIQELESNLANEKQVSAGKIQELETKIQELESEKNESKGNLQVTTDKNQELESNIQQLKSELEKEQELSRGKIQELELNIATAKTKNQELESGLATAETKNQVSTNKIEELKEKIESKNTEIQDLKTNLKTAEAKLLGFQQELESSKNDLSQAQTELETIKGNLLAEQEKSHADANTIETLEGQVNATNYFIEVINTYLITIEDLTAKNEYLSNITKINESSKELVESKYGITLGTTSDLFRTYILDPEHYTDYHPTIQALVGKLQTYNNLLSVKNGSAESYTTAFNELTAAANNMVNTEYSQVFEFPYYKNDDMINGLIELIQNYSSRLNTTNASSSCDDIFTTTNYLEETPNSFRFPTSAFTGMSVFEWVPQVLAGKIKPKFTKPFDISDIPPPIPDFRDNSKEINKQKSREIDTNINALTYSKMKIGCQQFPDPNIRIKLEYVEKEPAANWKEWIGDTYQSLQGIKDHKIRFVNVEIKGRLSSAAVGTLITQLTNTITNWQMLKKVVIDKEKDQDQLDYSLTIINDVIQNCELMLEYIYGLIGLGEILSNKYTRDPAGLFKMINPIARFIDISEIDLRYIGKTLPKDERARARLIELKDRSDETYNLILFNNISKAYNYAITALSDFKFLSMGAGDMILKILGFICVIVFIFILNSTFAFFRPLIDFLGGIIYLMWVSVKAAGNFGKKGYNMITQGQAIVNPQAAVNANQGEVGNANQGEVGNANQGEVGNANQGEVGNANQEEVGNANIMLPVGTVVIDFIVATGQKKKIWTITGYANDDYVVEDENGNIDVKGINDVAPYGGHIGRRGGKKLNKTRVMIKHGKTRKQKRRAKKQTKKPRKQRRYTRKRNVRK